MNVSRKLSGTLLEKIYRLHLRPPQPTRDDRGWIINPVGPNPWWTTIITFIPALLCTILIFMDQQITAVIINRKEHKLKVFKKFCFRSLP